MSACERGSSDDDDFAELCGLGSGDFADVEDASDNDDSEEVGTSRLLGHTIFSWDEVHPDIIRACWLFRQMTPVQNVIAALKAAGDQYTTEAFQELVVQHIVTDKPRAYHPASSYITNFLKKFMAEVEGSANAPSDVLVETLMANLQHARSSSDPTAAMRTDRCYKNYTIPTSGRLYPMRVATSAWNETGMALWPAGLLLTQYLLAHPEEVSGRRVVELGAGVGLTSIILAGELSPAAVVATDYCAEVMQNLRHNAQINSRRAAVPVQARTIDWMEWETFPDQLDFGADLIIAADVVFEPALVPALVQTTLLLLQAGTAPVTADGADGADGAGGADRADGANTTTKGQTNGRTNGQAGQAKKKAVFASCVRNWPTFEVFLAETARHGLVWRDVDFAPAARDEDIVFVLEEALGFSNEKIRICELSLR
jgi:hypothetical protein